MFRKISTFLLLAGALGLVLFLKNILFEKPTPPRIIDRLPTADFIATANILDLAKETNGMLQYNKIAVRDFTTYEFLLGQGKMYGLDLKQNVYLFGNENGNWGAMAKLTDSSKIKGGIERLKKFVKISDSTFNDQKFFYNLEDKSYLHYGVDYILFYKGNDFKSVLEHVINAQHMGIHRDWKRFLAQKQFKNEHLVIYSNWPKLKALGIETAMFAHDSDSSSFKLKSYLKKTKPLYFKEKQDALSYESSEGTQRMIDVHLDVEEFRKNKEDSMYVQLMKLGKRFSFPIAEFIKAWTGDLCFVEGGLQKVKEQYIETVLDEDFNETEVRREKEVLVPTYSALISMNEYGQLFLNKLMAKGFLRQDGNGFRFLFSPLLNMSKVGSVYQFYSASTAPKLVPSFNNHVTWTDKGTKYFFSIDSVTQHEIFGSLHIPVMRLFRRNKLI
ncbi:MAG: hypothetical protein ACO29Q_01710 [Crocinitomicaceae bacterium]